MIHILPEDGHSEWPGHVSYNSALPDDKEALVYTGQGTECTLNQILKYKQYLELLKGYIYGLESENFDMISKWLNSNEFFKSTL